MTHTIPTYRVELDVAGGQAVLDVPSLIGPEAAGRRARWTAIAAGWADVDEVRVVSVQPLLEAAGPAQPYLCDDPWEGKPVPHWHGLDTGTVALAVTLLVCILGGLLTLALIAAGQNAMCEARDQALSYCQPAEATR